MWVLKYSYNVLYYTGLHKINQEIDIQKIISINRPSI